MIHKVLNRFRGVFWRAASIPLLLLFNHSGIKVGKKSLFIGVPIVSIVKPSLIRIGRNVVLVSKSHPMALGVSRPVIIRTLLPNASILIGDNSGLSGTTICAAKSVSIGLRCLIGADVIISDTDFHEVDTLDRRYSPIPRPNAQDAVAIGDDVFIGARSIIMKGVHIGAGSVIGAESVVTKNIPIGVVAAGNPAKVRRYYLFVFFLIQRVNLKVKFQNV